jgi:hypothetical protein
VYFNVKPAFGCWHLVEVCLLPAFKRTILPLSSGLNECHNTHFNRDDRGSMILCYTSIKSTFTWFQHPKAGSASVMNHHESLKSVITHLRSVFFKNRFICLSHLEIKVFYVKKTDINPYDFLKVCDDG